MKSLIIYISVHHKNTEKIAEAIAEVLQSEIKKLNEVFDEDLSSYDMVGFGSGIYIWQHHKSIFNFVDKMTDKDRKPVFIFSTSGTKGGIKYHKELRNKLLKKNCYIIGEFNCLGWDSVGPLILVGGINKKRPNKKDLEDAKRFALTLKEKV